MMEGRLEPLSVDMKALMKVYLLDFQLELLLEHRKAYS